MDLIFMDLKLLDDDKHQAYTGQSNQRILENMTRLASLDAQVVIRIPVIGGVNDDEDNIRQSAAFVHRHLPKAQMELLPYHQFGQVKYQALGLVPPSPAFFRPSKETMDALRQLVLKEGIPLADYR